MAILKLASTKITPELLERLNRYTESTGLTQSAAIRQAIELFLDSVESTKSTELTNGEGSFRPSQLVARVDAVDDRLTDFEARLTAIESRSVMTTVKPIAVTKKAPDAPAPDGAMLTMSQLSKALTDLGHQHKLKNLSSRINASAKNQQLPSDLVALGVRADWEAETEENKYSNQRRWLSLVQVLEPESLIL